MTTDCKEVFGQLLRYFSESDDKRMCANIWAFAQACLAVGEFEAAEKYADILLVQDSGGAAQQISACRIKLFCRLKCKNDDDFFLFSGHKLPPHFLFDYGRGGVFLFGKSKLIFYRMRAYEIIFW